MSDLLGEIPSGANGNGNGNGAASSSARPIASRVPAPTSSPSGIRGPRMIMQERAAREQRQREERERERLEKEHAESEARMREQTARREVERREAEDRAAAAAATATTAAGAGRSGHGANLPATGAETPTGSRRPAQPSTSRARADTTTRMPSSRLAAEQHVPGTRGPSQTSITAQPVPGVQGSAPAGQHNVQSQTGEPSSAGAAGRPRNSFPHAFERWETLSAHWEGLTSFWIRRLEQSASEINNDPVSAQLSRQVTDLSSAGANLFHAVVELQRLRASSERKFQRWFFETREELERNQEVTAMLEAALEEERRNRADAIREAVEREKGTTKIEKQCSEMRKELLISKEEARRAWEELGRREQEERERTSSLQLGNPTIVGGVQVVPMNQGRGGGMPSRDAYPQEVQRPEYTTQSPVSQVSRPEYTQAPPTTSAEGRHQTQSPTDPSQGYSAEGVYTDGEYLIDANGNYVRDSRGNKVPFQEPSEAGAEDPATPTAPPEVYQPSGLGGEEPEDTEPDYSGEGYSAPGWEQMQPRHHHPTRLSDVIEEDDERSRTSASRSQVSRN